MRGCRRRPKDGRSGICDGWAEANICSRFDGTGPGDTGKVRTMQDAADLTTGRSAGDPARFRSCGWLSPKSGTCARNQGNKKRALARVAVGLLSSTALCHPGPGPGKSEVEEERTIHSKGNSSDARRQTPDAN